MTIPHDPDPARSFCPLCEEPWPCAERKRQRENQRWIRELLRSDLYEPMPWEESHGAGRLWRSPIGWQVWIGYGKGGLHVVVDDYARPPGSGAWVGTEDGTMEWLTGVLP